MSKPSAKTYELPEENADETRAADYVAAYGKAAGKTRRPRQKFKQTEVGMIPEDWEVTRIDSFAAIKTGARNTQDRKEDGIYPFFVRSQEVQSIDSYSFDTEAVLTAGDGVGTGKVFHYIAGRFDVHQRVYCIAEFSERLVGRYFFYQFSIRFFDRIMSMTAKSSVDSVRMEMIAGMLIPLPSPAEQCAIAAALSDVDGLLEALDRLIAKKRDLKKAAMQQLLTGKHRLPGFTGKWETKRLGDLFVLRAGTSKGKYRREHGRYFIVDMGSITREGKLSVSKMTDFEGDFLETGELVMPKDDIGGGLIIGRTGYIDADHKYILSDHVYALKLIEGDSKFLSFFINGYATNSSLRSKVTGSAQLGISKKTVEEQVVSVPDPVEQGVIASILSDMDEEIAALESRREKTRLLKQGMMQELLTGRIRLIEPEGAG